MNLLKAEAIAWPLHSVVDICRRQEDLSIMLETLLWVRGLANPHADLGRAGPVCPWIARALELDAVAFSVLHTPLLSAAAVARAVAPFGGRFSKLRPRSGQEAPYKAVVLILPDVPAQGCALLDRVQTELKPQFACKGQMIGEFHSASRKPGLHNPDFFPLRSPYPTLAIRSMVANDLGFLMQESDPPESRVQCLRQWLRRFGGSSPLLHTAAALAAVESARQQMKARARRMYAPAHRSVASIPTKRLSGQLQ